jgi:hypothetical protein
MFSIPWKPMTIQFWLRPGSWTLKSCASSKQTFRLRRPQGFYQTLQLVPVITTAHAAKKDGLWSTASIVTTHSEYPLPSLLYFALHLHGRTVFLARLLPGTIAPADIFFSSKNGNYHAFWPFRVSFYAI